MTPFKNPDVAIAFKRYPAKARTKLMTLRELIFKTASATPSIGELEECLKWGEPAYLTSQSKSGSTIRIDWKPASPKHYAMYFHCQSNLIDTFRTLFPNEFIFEGNRAIVFELSKPLPIDAVQFCINAALTYHRNKPKS